MYVQFTHSKITDCVEEIKHVYPNFKIRIKCFSIKIVAREIIADCENVKMCWLSTTDNKHVDSSPEPASNSLPGSPGSPQPDDSDESK